MHIFVYKKKIENLSLIDIPFGTLTIEAVASTSPNLLHAEFSGSDVITDIAVRCFTTVCMYLKELTFKFCPKLTDDAFTRCI